MARPSRFSPEVRDRAVRMVLEQQDKHESQWAAITSIAEKIGCTAETLRKWVRQAERDQGVRPGLTTEERQRLKQLERETFELRRANEILDWRDVRGPLMVSPVFTCRTIPSRLPTAAHAWAGWRASLPFRPLSVGKVLIRLPALCSARRSS